MTSYRSRLSRYRPSNIAVGYIAIGAFALAAYAAEALFPHNHVAATYGPNLAAEALGILVTVVFVERLLKWQRERELAPIRAVAARRSRRAVYSIVQFVGWTYKAAAPPGSQAPRSYDDLFALWASHAPWLDFKSPAPILPARTWAAYGTDAFSEIESALIDVIDRYAEALGSEFIVAAEDLLDHSIFAIVKNGWSVELIDAEMGYDLPRLPLSMTDLTTEALALQEFVPLVQRLFAAFVRIAPEVMEFSARDFDDDTLPKWGSGRFEPRMRQVEG